jgi:hypothetical protein
MMLTLLKPPIATALAAAGLPLLPPVYACLLSLHKFQRSSCFKWYLILHSMFHSFLVRSHKVLLAGAFRRDR